MDGITTTAPGATASEATSDSEQREEFVTNVKQSLRQYFNKLDGEQPNKLYELVLAEMEIPLFKMIIRFTSGNQSKAAKMLGISRGTLRKKLALYDFND